jgi:uncharacterized protein (UPF0335 family)
MSAEPLQIVRPNVSTTAELIRSAIKKIESCEEDIAAAQADRKEIYAEARGNGLDTKILRKIVALRKRNRQEVAEEAELVDLYLGALGELPLFSRHTPKKSD